MPPSGFILCMEFFISRRARPMCPAGKIIAENVVLTLPHAIVGADQTIPYMSVYISLISRCDDRFITHYNQHTPLQIIHHILDTAVQHPYIKLSQLKKTYKLSHRRNLR